MSRPPVRTEEALLRAHERRLTLLERRKTAGLLDLPGRLSKTGQEVDDWNDATEPGFYWGRDAANQPAGDTYWAVETSATVNGNTIYQQATPLGTPDGGTRWRYSKDNGATWSEWSFDLAAEKLRLTGTGDASPTSVNHAFQIGDTAGPNVIIDNNEMMARNDGEIRNLYIEGGISVGGSSSAYNGIGLSLSNSRINATHYPYAVASGTSLSASNSGSSGTTYWDGGVTVTLPSGRFTQEPNIVLTPIRSGQVLGANLIQSSSTSFIVRTIRFGAEIVSGTAVRWVAVQMNEGGSSG